jgi:hypothetical protein
MFASWIYILDNGWSYISSDNWYQLPFTLDLQNIPVDLVNFYNIYYGVIAKQNKWHKIYDKKFALIISSGFNSLDAYGEKITIQPSSLQTITINRYNDISFNNTKIEYDVYTGDENIVLNLPDKIISIILDQSGSMVWNDENNLRYDMIKRFVSRVSATYPGNVEYNLFKYGGKVVKVLFASNISSKNPFNPDFNLSDIYEKDKFYDDVSDFYGFRILRKEGSFSSSPIDGEIVFDGIINKIEESNLESGKEYYYSLYTFDINYNFSEPTRIKVIPRDRTIPKGVKTFYSEVLKGSSVLLDDNTLAVWHFDEGEDEIVYDFTSNYDLDITSNTPIIWLNELDRKSVV